MRVLYVTHNSWLRSTTSPLNATIRSLRSRGGEPVLLFRWRGPWQRELESEGVPCYFDPLSFPSKSQPLRSLSHIWKTIKIIRRHSVNLIHCNEHETYPLLRHAARLTGRPAVVTLHWDLSPGFG